MTDTPRRRFELAKLAPQVAVRRFAPEIDRILDVLGHPEALVTDESTFSDFPLDNPPALWRTLGVTFNPDDTLVAIAKRMRAHG